MVKPPALSAITTPTLPSFDFLRKKNGTNQKSKKFNGAQTQPNNRYVTAGYSAPPEAIAGSYNRYAVQSPSNRHDRSPKPNCITPFSSISDSRSLHSTCPSIMSTGTTGPYSSTFEKVPGGWRPIPEEKEEPTINVMRVSQTQQQTQQADFWPEPWTWHHIAARKQQHFRKAKLGYQKLGQRDGIHKFALRGGDSQLLFFEPKSQFASNKQNTLRGERNSLGESDQEVGQYVNHTQTAPASLGLKSNFGGLQSVGEEGENEGTSASMNTARTAMEQKPNGSKSPTVAPAKSPTNTRLSQQGFNEPVQDLTSGDKKAGNKATKDAQEVSDNDSDSSEVFEGGGDDKEAEEEKNEAPGSSPNGNKSPQKYLSTTSFGMSAQEALAFGFDSDQLQEYKEIFFEFDTDQSGTINLNELRSMFRNLGHHPPPRLLYEVLCAAQNGATADSEEVREMDFREFLHVMQLLNKHEHEVSQSLFLAHDSDGSGELSVSGFSAVLESLGYDPSFENLRSVLSQFEKDQNGTFNQDEFKELLKAYRQIDKKEVRRRCGFTQEEVINLREAFEHYDSDRSGALGGSELISVIRDCNLLPKTREQQRRLQTQMEEAMGSIDAQLGFEKFLVLMRKFMDHDECEQYAKERRTAVSCGFTEREVVELREIFDTLLVESEVPELTIFSIKQLLRSLGASLAPAQTQELKKIFDRFAQGAGEKRGLTLPFPEFLMLMKDLLAKDFAGLHEAAKRTTIQREVEKKKMEELMKKVQEQKRIRASNRRSTLTSSNLDLQLPGIQQLQQQLGPSSN